MADTSEPLNAGTSEPLNAGVPPGASAPDGDDQRHVSPWGAVGSLLVLPLGITVAEALADNSAHSLIRPLRSSRAVASA